jgi:polyhydroxyalkanoate synthase
MTHPKIPVDLILAKLAAEAAKTHHRLEKARDILLGPLNTDIATTPHEVVYQEDRVRLRHYRPVKKPRFKTPLLLIYALINRETMLDLQPGRSLVNNLLKEGLEIYLVDWGSPSRKDRFLTLDDHVNGYLDTMVDFIRERHQLPNLNLMGFSMGGTLAVMYAALHPGKVHNLITAVTPVDFDTDKGLLHLWLKDIQVDRLVDTFGNMPGDLLNTAFLLLNPARLIFDKYVGFLENMDNQEFVENFIRMEKWIFDSPDVPGETFRQFIKECYQQNLLVKGKISLGGRPVDLKKITMPLLNIYARYDHLVPPEACVPLANQVGSNDTTEICLDTGHIGIYLSAQAQGELIPRMVAWLAERQNQARPCRPAAPRRGKKTVSDKGNGH